VATVISSDLCLSENSTPDLARDDRALPPRLKMTASPIPSKHTADSMTGAIRFGLRATFLGRISRAYGSGSKARFKGYDMAA
jgi:hypothetical protein